MIGVCPYPHGADPEDYVEIVVNRNDRFELRQLLKRLEKESSEHARTDHGRRSDTARESQLAFDALNRVLGQLPTT